MTLEIVRRKYFRDNARTMGVIIFVFTAFQLIEGNVYGLGIPLFILFNLAAISFWTAKEIIHIDTSAKRIGEGFRIFGLKRISWTNYSEIEKIYINSVNTVGLEGYSLTKMLKVREKVFKAFIKTTDGDKIFLIADSDKKLILKKLSEFNQTLHTQIFDTSN